MTARSPLELRWRLATAQDAELLGRMNIELREDEKAAPALTDAEVIDRMRDWLSGGYRAAVFEATGEVVAYALYADSGDDRTPGQGCIYLRQFFVRRDQRRQGVGRAAFTLWQNQCVPPSVPIEIDVLVHNNVGFSFWESIGFISRYTRMRLTETTPPANA